MLENFNPNATGAQGAGIFGLPFTAETAEMILIPVPWEATTSYGGGTSDGPQAILEASPQLDLFDLDFGAFYRRGIYMKPPTEAEWIVRANREAKVEVQKIIRHLEQGEPMTEELQKSAAWVNESSDKINEWVYQTSKAYLLNGKKVGVVGGDHSCPLGLLWALSEKYNGEFGILHVDAHSDTREGYQGFKYSHASIMRNVMEDSRRPQKVVQVGIRDFSEDEFEFTDKRPDVRVYFDQHIRRELHSGKNWRDLCREIVRELPQKVYVSFDIDGLEPAFCPHTGTPVPGGLSYSEAMTLLYALKEENKEVIGFDLCEVTPGPEGNEWDANVGARLLYKLCGYTLVTGK